MLIDASFRDETRRRLFLEAAHRWGVAGCMMLCRAEPDVVRRRLEHRRGDASDAGWTIYEEAARRWEEPGATTRDVSHMIDADGPPARCSTGRRGAAEAGLMD